MDPSTLGAFVVAQSMLPVEKRQIADRLLRQGAGRVPAIVGCSGAGQRERMALESMACALGSQAMLCQAPLGLRGQVLRVEMDALTRIGRSGQTP